MLHSHLAFSAVFAAVVTVVTVATDAQAQSAPRTFDQGACFRRDYDPAYLKSHRGQVTSSIVLSLRADPRSPKDPYVRVMLRLRDHREPLYLAGGCDSYPHDKPTKEVQSLLGIGRDPNGLDCILIESPESAREAGYLAIDFSTDLRTLVLALDEYAAAWTGLDQSKKARDIRFGAQDRVFRLDLTNPQACRIMDERIEIN